MGDTLEMLEADEEDERYDEDPEATAIVAAEGTIVEEQDGEDPGTAVTLPVPAAEPTSLERLQELVGMALESGKYPGHTGYELLMKAKIGEELGLGPATSFGAIRKIADSFNISAELQRALLRRAGYRIKEIQLTDTTCELALMNDDMSVEYGRCTYTMEDAKKAGLLKNEVWHKHTKSMLWASCSRTLVGRFCPEIRYWSHGHPL